MKRRHEASPTPCVPRTDKFGGDALAAMPRLPQGVHRCSCGVATFPQPNATGGDWVWVDAEGRESVYVGAPGFEDGPWGVLGFHRLHMSTGADQGRRMAHAQAYSSLKARMDLGMFNPWHRHDGREVEYPDNEPAVPWCHGSPMWAAPRGWVCREAGGTFPYGSA